MTETPTSKLASVLLKVELSEWVQARRREGMAWLQVARELDTATDGQVRVSAEWLRAKYGPVAPKAEVSPESRKSA